MRKGKLIGFLVVLVLVVVILTVVLIISSLNKNKDNGGNSNNNTGMPNPAATSCTEKGYSYEIRNNPDGSQYGVCIFPDESECEEWAYYRNECKIGDSLK